MKRIYQMMIEAETENGINAGFLHAVKAIHEHEYQASGIGINSNNEKERFTFTTLDSADKQMGIQQLGHVIDIVDAVIQILIQIDTNHEPAPTKPADELAAMKDVMNLINKLKEAK